MADGETDEEVSCGEDLVFFSDGNIDIEALHAVGEAHNVIVKRMHSECASDEVDECEDNMVWISDGKDFDLSELHELGNGHKVIGIHKSHGDAGIEVEVESTTDKVIIIEKK